jgi:hypothetical protein
MPSTPLATHPRGDTGLKPVSTDPLDAYREYTREAPGIYRELHKQGALHGTSGDGSFVFLRITAVTGSVIYSCSNQNTKEGTSTHTLILRDDGGQEFSFTFAGKVDLPPHQPITVRGYQVVSSTPRSLLENEPEDPTKPLNDLRKLLGGTLPGTAFLVSAGSDVLGVDTAAEQFVTQLGIFSSRKWPEFLQGLPR